MTCPQAEFDCYLSEAICKKYGLPCRVVGYLRPVQSWNKGKKEEFKMRKKFSCEC